MVSGPLYSSPENFTQVPAFSHFDRGRHALRGLWSRLWRHSATRSGSAAPKRRASDRPGELDLAAQSRALKQALDQHPRSRSMLRHLTIFEKALRQHGEHVLEKLPTSFLYRVYVQLEGFATDESLRRLTILIDQALERRMQDAERELAFVSSLEFTDQVEVEEFVGDDALREFSMLWKDGRALGMPQAEATAPRSTRAEGDWPHTQPQRP